MKILFFTNEYSHRSLPATGGVGSAIKILAQELSNMGHEVHIYGFSKNAHSFKDGKIKVLFFKKFSKKFPVIEAIRSIGSKLKIKSAELSYLEKERKYLAKKLRKYALKNQIDIIESFVFNGYTAFWDNSIPLVLRCHGSRGFWHYYLNRPKDEHKILMEQRALEATPFIAAVSKFSAQAVKKIYNIEVSKVIYNGIDHKLFAPDNTVKEIPQSLFYFGTLSAAKGVDNLCHIFNFIIEKYPNASLHIIGKGKDYWEQTCKEILSEKALQASSYYGAKNNAEIPQILQRAAVCVFTSKNENFSMVYLESMAMAKPSIVSNIDAAREIIDHEENGFLANATEDYSKYISLLFESPSLRKSIGQAARKKIVEGFTKETMTNKTLNYYQEILNRRNRKK